VLALASDVEDDVFNVASGVETSLIELAKQLLDVMDSSLKPEFGPARKVNPVPRRLADTSKAEKILGFRSEVDVGEGLRRLVCWWRADRDAMHSTSPKRSALFGHIEI
jgi:UDP-glucose 4-epimerase